MRVQTPFTILGYPGLAMLLFLAAAGRRCLDGVGDSLPRRSHAHALAGS